MDTRKILLFAIIIASISFLPAFAKRVSIENLPSGTYAYITQGRSKEIRIIFQKRDKVVIGMEDGYSCFLGIVKGSIIRDVVTVQYPQNIGTVKLVKLPSIDLGSTLQLNFKQELNKKSRSDSAGYPVEAGSTRTVGDRFNECLQDPNHFKKEFPTNTQIRRYAP